LAIGRYGRRLKEIRCAVGRRAAPGLDHRRRGRAQWGYTLIELMVVMSLIVILATMSLVQYRQSVVRSKEAVLKEDLFRMRDALDQYYADKNQYPATLDALVTDGYLRRLPKDPFTDSESSWQTVQAEPDPANLTGEPGVSDVKSGSEAQALDGTNYSEW
jgi:general secretion pathway protein G